MTTMNRLNDRLSGMTTEQLRRLERGLMCTFPNLGDVSPVRFLGQGWGSVAVETANHLVFKIAKAKIFQEQHEKQFKILPQIAGKFSFAMPVPEYYSGPSDEFQFGVMGYKKIVGTIPTHSQVIGRADSMSKEVANLLKSFHSLTPPENFQASDYPGAGGPAQKLETVWAQDKDWLRSKFSRSDYRQIADQWREILQFNEPAERPRVLVQGDPWYGNLIVDESGHLTGIVDFDKLHLGDPAIDFGAQQYASTEFMLEVVRQYRKLGGYAGENLEQRIKTVMQIKSLKDLAYCLRIGHMYDGMFTKIENAFLV